MLKAVALESYALQDGDLDWGPVKKLVDEFEHYPRTQPHEVIQRLKGAQIVIVNKVNINDEVLEACPDLKWVGITATGVDTLDIEACRRHNVPVANVPGYSTYSVAQMAMALLLELCHCAGRYDASVRRGHWQVDIPKDANIVGHMELRGKTVGLIGYGNIARQVAVLANAFGMHVLCNTRTVRDEYKNDCVSFVTRQELFANSDIISLHCPSTPQTRHIINAQALADCKRGVRIINTARGALIDEAALIEALNTGAVGAFATDVVQKEPIAKNDPLLNAPNVIITPHIAWATPASLKQLMNTVGANLESYLNGGSLNVVN